MGSELDRHKEKLIDVMEKEVTYMFEQILNYTEVAVPNRDQYNRLRSKVLRLGNDCKRNLKKSVERDFVVKFDARNEDVIEFASRKQGQC